jgi:hypothetical protein
MKKNQNTCSFENNMQSKEIGKNINYFNCLLPKKIFNKNFPKSACSYASSPKRPSSSIKISLSSSKISSWFMKVEIEDLSPTKQLR